MAELGVLSYRDLHAHILGVGAVILELHGLNEQSALCLGEEHFAAPGSFGQVQVGCV